MSIFEGLGEAPNATRRPPSPPPRAPSGGGFKVGGVVGHSDRVLLGLEAVERGDRAKDLLLGNDHVAILSRKNRLRPSRTPVPPVLSGRDQASPTPSKTKGPARGAPISQRYDGIMAVLQLLNTQFPPARPAGVRAMAATRRPAPPSSQIPNRSRTR